MINKIHAVLYRCFNILRPPIRIMMYKNFKLFYSHCDSLVDRINKEGEYELSLSQHIVSVLKSTTKPVFLDVGANIGLISLNILADVPQTIIYAFEPGPHQYLLFSKTIRENNFSNIFLYKEALSNKLGKSIFSVHKTAHSSGNGFVDTGRAGSSKLIVVECQTVNNWWTTNYKPDITAIKIDTEGSELMVLEGATDVLSNCKPYLFIEIWPENLKSYSYNSRDILVWLNSHNYSLFCLDGVQVNLNNCSQFFGVNESFIARPIF